MDEKVKGVRLLTRSTMSYPKSTLHVAPASKTGSDEHASRALHVLATPRPGPGGSIYSQAGSLWGALGLANTSALGDTLFVAVAMAILLRAESCHLRQRRVNLRATVVLEQPSRVGKVFDSILDFVAVRTLGSARAVGTVHTTVTCYNSRRTVRQRARYCWSILKSASEVTVAPVAHL